MDFPEFEKNFGFGCMRLPMDGKVVDDAQFTQMVDEFLAAGFRYFDTAHGYLDGESERAIRRCLSSRYPRDRYFLTNKLTGFYFETQEQIRPLFAQQLEACGVDYFDFYLMHAQNKESFAKFKRCRAYETALEFKEEGKIRRFGISFHDTAEVLEQILCEYPQIEAVQLQFNYVDFDDPAVQSRACWEVCRRHGKPVIVMEPVKGGSLVNLPDEAKKVYDALGGSYAGYALRFAAGFEGVAMVLSGMSSPAQMRDNLAVMRGFRPLSDAEKTAVTQVCAILKGKALIPCTACRYCTAGCPMDISIPDLFACYNAKTVFHDWNQDFYYGAVHTAGHGKASDCVCCGQCEEACPQHLPIRELLQKVAEEFETAHPIVG